MNPQCYNLSQALGLKPKKRKVAQQPHLSEEELAELMRKARGDGGAEPPSTEDAADRMGGLGFRLCVLQNPSLRVLCPLLFIPEKSSLRPLLLTACAQSIKASKCV